MYSFHMSMFSGGDLLNSRPLSSVFGLLSLVFLPKKKRRLFRRRFNNNPT